jgi:hypothetical protein
MKTFSPLLMAVMASSSLFAQTTPLNHADSIVLMEAGGLDSLARVDSSLRAHTETRPFPVVINAVLRDFPNSLKNITGELVLAQGEIENYSSMVVLPGAESCMITRYHSVDDTTVSWQAKMYNYDDFDKASKDYRELFNKLKGCYLKLVDGSIIYLNGEWEPAKESAAFTTSTFRLTTGDWRYKDVRVELELVYLLADWAIHINISTKKRDDEVGGGTSVSELQ